MSDVARTRCLVLGVGKMGSAHLQALAALRPGALAGWAPSGAHRDSATAVGAEFLGGSLENALRTFRPTHVIVATPVQTLTPTALAVLAAGVRHVLVEKPVALSVAEGRQLAAGAAACGAHVCAGYNRRFYGSVRTALDRLRSRGEEVQSVFFDFSEPAEIPPGPPWHAPEVRARWVIANSLHVVDTALLPIGWPNLAKSRFRASGSMPWHPTASMFVGAGETERGKSFEYRASWCAAGSWSVEWAASSERYVFRPMENLSVVRTGTTDVEEVTSSDDFDRRFKPGVFLQNKAFIEESNGVATLTDALSLLTVGEAIGAYASTS